mmetsp:Transcript_94171/g.203536  ORF Transcript_94171/g.203536 Transcript_94171/m.203536 type:complete len:476 (+) Transcript_94171:35-1462(+)
MKSTLAVLLLSALTAAAFPEEKGVLVLDDSNFDAAIKEHDYILVEFYAPWCGHCKKLEPEYASAAASLKGTDGKLAKVDATEAKGLAERFAIKGFPTLKMFKQGEPSEYQGGRSAADIVNYVKKASGPAAKTLSTAADYAAMEEENLVFVVGYFADADSANAKAFMAAAARDDNSVYAITSSDELKGSLGVSEDTIMVVKAGEDRADHKVGTFDRAAVEGFIAGNRLPLINEFSPENSKAIFGSSIKKHALFFTNSEKDYHDKVMGHFREVGAAFRGQLLMVRVPSSEAKVMEYFGFKAADLPAFVLADMSGDGQMKKFIYSGEYETAAITTFVEDFLAKKLKVVLKSEAVTPEDTAGNVKIVKGDSFNDIVINNNKDVLVEFYAPWCGHCKKLQPTWDALAEQMKGVDSVVIAKSDATANEFDVEGLNIKGFPTIYFFKGDDKTPRVYNEGREVEDFVEFLQTNGATKFNHAEL